MIKKKTHTSVYGSYFKWHVYEKEAQICLKEMQRKFHVWRQNRGKLGQEELYKLYLIVHQTGSQQLCWALHKMPKTAANLSILKMEDLGAEIGNATGETPEKDCK